MTATLQSAALLREFVEHRSDTAFAELVSCHVDLVYSTALRRCAGNSAAAQDVAQTVFTDLARKASSLPHEIVLPAWLYRHTLFVASSLIRAEQRRRQREQTAMDLQALDDSTDWSVLAPVLDDALRDLPDRDRDAIILRFLDQQSFAHVGAVLGVSEDAARMRVDRALDKLRPLLARRGAKSTVAALALALSQHATLAAPGGLATSIASAALSTAATTAVVTSTTSGILHVMASSKLAIGLTTLIAAGAATTAFVQHRTNTRLHAEIGAVRTELEVARSNAADAASQASARAAELAELQRQRIELMDLRDKAARLRETEAALARLEGEKRALEAATDKPTNDEETPVDPITETHRGIAMARMGYTQGWGLAFHNYASENNGSVPTSFEEAARYYPEEWNSLLSAFDQSRFEIVLQGSLKDVAHPARTILIREKASYTTPGPDGNPVYARTYVFADGHSEIHSSPNDDFEPWERERMPTAPTP